MMRFVLCLSNHRVGETAGGARFISMLVGDKELPSLTGPGIYGYSDGPGESYVMHSGDILGDEGGEDHGTHGTLLFYPGRWDQTRYGNDRWSTDTISELPAYRGQVAITLAGSNPGDTLNRIESSATPGSYYVSWYFGDSPTLPPYSFIIENPVTIPGYEDVTAPIGNGDANPAAVIYDVLTNPFGRVGLDPALVDVDSFADVAATLRDEEHGISIVFAGSEDAQRIVRTILDQIDGVMYVDPATGKLVLGLIREDYVVADLPVVTTSNVIGKPKKPGTLWAGTVNVVRVTWSDPSKGYRDAVATADDPANVAAQGGYQRPRDFAFPGVTNPILAYFLANRSLPWWAVGLSVMATQLSAITLVGTTGQGYADGMRFIQFYFGLPLAIFLLYNFIAEIPSDVIEAARVDGAGHGQIFFRIILPMSLPPIVTLAILQFIAAWNEYFWPLLLSRTPENSVIQIGIQMFMTTEGTLWGPLMAASTMASLPVLLIYLVLQRQVVQSFMKSGIR